MFLPQLELLSIGASARREMNVHLLCSQARVSLVRPADRHGLKCQGLAVCGAPSIGRGLSLRNVRTLNKQQHSSDILYPPVQPDTTQSLDWVRGLHVLAKLLLSFLFCNTGPDLRLFCSLIVSMVLYYFPSSCLWNSCEILLARLLKFHFYPPPLSHNRACCSRSAVNCQQLNKKPGSVKLGPPSTVYVENRVHFKRKRVLRWHSPNFCVCSSART